MFENLYLGTRMDGHTKYSVSLGFSEGVGVSWVSRVRKVTGLFWTSLVLESLDGEGMGYTAEQWPSPCRV